MICANETGDQVEGVCAARNAERAHGSLERVHGGHRRRLGRGRSCARAWRRWATRDLVREVVRARDLMRGVVRTTWGVGACMEGARLGV